MPAAALALQEAPPRPATLADKRDELAYALLRTDIAAEGLEIATGCDGMRDRLVDIRREAQALYRELRGHEMP